MCSCAYTWPGCLKVREISCALRIELSTITFHRDFILRYSSDIFLCVAQIWTEEPWIKERVTYRLTSFLLALEICLLLRALELGKSWTAIIIDNRNGEDCYPISCRTEYWVLNWVCDWDVTLMHQKSTCQNAWHLILNLTFCLSKNKTTFKCDLKKKLHIIDL